MNNHSARLNIGAPGAGGTEEYLSFRIGHEEYGIKILCVQEIRSYEQPTRLANVPSFIKGVVNLRGVIVPIVDMRIRLGIERVEYNDFTVVVLLNVRDRVVGVVVDSVSDVIRLAKDDIRPMPKMSCAIDMDFITGIVALNDRMIILADIEGLLAGQEFGLFDQAEEELVAG